MTHTAHSKPGPGDAGLITPDSAFLAEINRILAPDQIQFHRFEYDEGEEDKIIEHLIPNILPKRIFGDYQDSCHYITMKRAKGEVVEVGVAYAMAFSTHEYGRLKPALKKIVGAWREKFGVYRSDRWNDLFKVKTKRERGETKAFADRMKKLCETTEKQNKVALSRGDPTAVGVEKLKAAWAAFFNALK